MPLKREGAHTGLACDDAVLMGSGRTVAQVPFILEGAFRDPGRIHPGARILEELRIDLT